MSQLPRPFGAYVLEEYLAAGGMAEVYVGRRADDPSGARVCVKTVLPHLSNTGDFATMFEDEVWLGRRLDHDNVVRTFDAGEQDGVRFMVMELVEGLDLAGLFKHLARQRRGFQVGEAVSICVGMCRGLHHAHGLSEGSQPLHVVHRDVSPQNVLLDRSGHVKVTDFGIAKARGRTTHTQTGIVKGKVAYMAPEQALGQPLDHRVDQFATATVLWEMLVGRRLFHDKSDLLTLEKIIKRKTAPPSTLRPDVGKRLDAVLLKALAKRPQDRWPDMAAFENALLKACAQVPGVDDPVGTVARLVEGVLGGVEEEADLGEGASLTRGVAVKRRGGPSAATALFGGAGTGAHPASGTAVTAPLRTPERGGAGYIPAELRAPDPSPEADAPPPPPVVTPTPLPTPVPAVPASGPGALDGGLRVMQVGASRPLSIAEAAGVPAAGTGSASRTVYVEKKLDWRLGLLAALLCLALGGAVGWFGKGVETLCAGTASSALVREQASQLLDAAELMLSRGEVKSAVEQLTRALKLHGSARGYAMAGRLRVQAGDFPGALAAWRCALELEPSAPDAELIRDRMRQSIR